MKKIVLLLSFIFLIGSVKIYSQAHYGVSITEFSSDKYDEFCPVFYEDQLVFCTNQEDELLITYKNKRNKALFNIFKVNIDTLEDPRASILSRNLLTPFNDGPAAFNPNGNIIVYSRNIDINAKVKNVFDPNNKLGLYFAELVEGEWTNIREFKHNSIKYSNTSPCFSPDGQYLYFGSDMPGGFGGADIYRSQLIDEEWSEPVNLGETINTKGNEVYPFISLSGDLFFASDGHEGFGKKDIFFSRKSDSEWIAPIHLEAPINSKDDDFGLITDMDFEKGYFSSSRGKTDDIYKFETLIPQLFGCDTLLENQYCYEFWDEQYPGIDSLPVIYEWEFSDGVRERGLVIEHCFQGAGKYWAKLNIIDNTTSNIFFTQSSMDFELEDHIQAFISSKEAGLVDADIDFDGLSSNLPGFSVQEYVWDFGDGSFSTGSEIRHQFEKAGVYGIKLGLMGFVDGSENKTTNCVIKNITIVPDNQALAMFFSGEDQIYMEVEGMERDESDIQQDFSVFDVDPDEEVFRVEVLSSDKKLMPEDSIFDPLREDYEIKEFYLTEDSLYSYTVGEHNSLLETYEVYGDVVSKGFTSAQVKTYIIAELPTDVVAKINRDFAELADANFEFSQFEVSESSHAMLDKIVEILKNYPDLSMEIAAHTDNVGSFEFNLQLSEKRANSIVNYLVSQGVDKVRLLGKGYGESRPIASNNTEEGQKMNRRVEFIILND